MSSKNKIILVGVTLIFIISLSIIYLLLPKVEITLNDEENITILLGNDYVEKGASAKKKTLFSSKDLKVKINGTVNTNKIGKYILIYEVDDKHNFKSVMRIVNVIDNIKPVIESKKDVTMCKSNNLLDYDIIATDNYDNDITSKVEYTILNDEIIFTVKDSSNNETELRKKINYIDNEHPTIILNGNEYIYLNKDDKYVEYGAKATDSCDGDLTSKINIKHNINTSIPNKYEVTYTVSDNLGNKTEIKRYVIVYEKEENYTEHKVLNEAIIYLTFDDGPGAYTKELLRILKENDVLATFFVTGQFLNYKHLIKEAYDDGHAIGIHTYTHKWSIYKSVEDYLSDFNKIDNLIYEQTGMHTKLFRFPGGSSNTVSIKYHKRIMSKLAYLMEEKGYVYFDWTFDSGDTNKKNNSVEYILNSFKKNLKGDGHYVVLMHDIKKNTILAMPKIIEFAKTNGYKFEKLTTTSPTAHLKIAN